uniref:DUF4218 domain-containing protein n=1 Tax=Oryza glaberrima TaxID=4538 RepID=I1Q696_ORYGL
HIKLSCVLELIKLKASNGWSDKSFTELLELLKDMLLEGNNLPQTTYEAKQVLCPLGLEPTSLEKRGKLERQKRRARRRKKQRSMWKNMSIFWRLPYWKDLEVRHCIDLMHVEKNVCESLMGLLLNPGATKDGLNARRDLEEMGVRSELHPITTESGRVYLPPACYTLSKEEKIDLLTCLSGIKVPSGYSSRISRLVSLQDLKLVGMKSHDCHVLITQLLPVALRNILPPKVRYTIQQLCSFFHAIGQKIIDPEGLNELQAELVRTLCHLEMYFPPTFFDIIEHLPVHLVRQTKCCGPAFMT